MGTLADDLRAVIAARNAIVIVGAGVSIEASGHAPQASWRGLLETGIDRCVEVSAASARWAELQHHLLELDDLETWLAIAEQVTIRLGGSKGGEFGRWLRETVGSMQLTAQGRELVEAVAALQVPIFTTNYDGLVEAGTGLEPVTWQNGPKVQRIVRGDSNGIVHLHGYWDVSESVVLGVRSYERALADASAQALLQALATTRSIVLVGFGAGLRDPNFTALRQWMARAWSGSEYRHYRLVLECEQAAVAAEHAPQERIMPVVYGATHDKLAGFLRGLTTHRSGGSPSGTQADEDPFLDPPSPGLIESLDACIALYDGRPWTDHAIDIQAQTPDGTTHDAREMALGLMRDGPPSVVLVSGRSGSGKTWLLRSVARQLAQDVLGGRAGAPIPLFLPLVSLAPTAASCSWRDLLNGVVPLSVEPGDLSPGAPVALLLDGVDELLAFGTDGLKRLKRVLTDIALVVPAGSRYLVSCREEVLSTVDVHGELEAHLTGDDRADRTGEAVGRALGIPARNLVSLSLREVTPSQADAYLRASPAASAWREIADQTPYLDLLVSPVTLFLMEQALPMLAEEAQEPQLPGLYKAAIDTWLYRSGVREGNEKDRLLRRLDALAVGLLEFGMVSRDDEADAALRRASLLVDLNAGYALRHYSFVDYSLARTIVREFQAFSSPLLGRLNLVAMYNVHRFAIPALLALLPGPGTTDAALQPVSSADFQEFVNRTSWRSHGYGIWPNLRAHDGTRPFDPAGFSRTANAREGGIAGWSATPNFESPAMPVTGVSWYDCAAFAHYAGRRLPTVEMALAQPHSAVVRAPFEWTASWYRERDGLMAVVGPGDPEDRDRILGVNPDLRSEQIGVSTV